MQDRQTQIITDENQAFNMLVKSRNISIKNLINRLREAPKNNALLIRCLERKLLTIEEDTRTFINHQLKESIDIQRNFESKIFEISEHESDNKISERLSTIPLNDQLKNEDNKERSQMIKRNLDIQKMKEQSSSKKYENSLQGSLSKNKKDSKTNEQNLTPEIDQLEGSYQRSNSSNNFSTNKHSSNKRNFNDFNKKESNDENCLSNLQDSNMRYISLNKKKSSINSDLIDMSNQQQKLNTINLFNEKTSSNIMIDDDEILNYGYEFDNDQYESNDQYHTNDDRIDNQKKISDNSADKTHSSHDKVSLHEFGENLIGRKTLNSDLRQKLKLSLQNNYKLDNQDLNK